MENGCGTLPCNHSKQGELFKVQGGAGGEAACQEVDKSSWCSRVETEHPLKCNLVAEVKHLKLLLAQHQ